MVEREPAGTFRVLARGAKRPELLTALASAARFELPPLGALPPLRLDLDLHGATAESVLARALADVPHDLYYLPTGPDGASTLRSVSIETPAAPAHPAQAAGGHFAAAAGRETEAGLHPPRGRDPQSEEDRLSEIATLRDSRVDGERAHAASLMQPEDDMAGLLAYLASDASADVRASAATSLGDVWGGENAYHAVDALLAALSDRDAHVVAAAVGALEDIYDVLPDPRIREQVRALGDRGDPTLHEALDSFREWSEEAQ